METKKKSDKIPISIQTILEPTKAELLQVLRYFFPHPFICMRNFISKKVGNRKS